MWGVEHIVTGLNSNMDKILLLGANGQVGWELQRALAVLGDVNACDQHEANFENLQDLATLVDDFNPTIIVNAAAYTAVDKAESEPEKVKQINADAVALLASKAKKFEAWLIHYSTDYVFDGTSSLPYKESDKTNPQSVYGITKFQGEEAIKESGCKHLIFRTSWVYAARGANFAKTMIKLAQDREELKVVNDQIGAPASAELIADITTLCLYRINQDTASAFSGVYNLVPKGEVSWYDFAKYILVKTQKYGVKFKVKPENIIPISTKDYPTPAKRPANSRLDVTKIIDTFGIYIPHWQKHADRFIDELYVKESI